MVRRLLLCSVPMTITRRHWKMSTVVAQWLLITIRAEKLHSRHTEQPVAMKNLKPHSVLDHYKWFV
ncbi:hypothetical protein Ab1vBOLIVR4_gp79 [Agrobacterium phage OLIVR4]|nr:hypothetical protein Ab1vBOLIVR4_gp79 [Agrobacterium phage OLIVR4]